MHFFKVILLTILVSNIFCHEKTLQFLADTEGQSISTRIASVSTTTSLKLDLNLQSGSGNINLTDFNIFNCFQDGYAVTVQLPVDKEDTITTVPILPQIAVNVLTLLNAAFAKMFAIKNNRIIFLLLSFSLLIKN